MGKTEGKRTLGRPRRRFEDYFNMDLREIGWNSKGKAIRVTGRGGQ
jgi:hypothetical protein